MADTTQPGKPTRAKRKPAKAKAAKTTRRKASASASKAGARKATGASARGADGGLPQDLLKSVEDGQRAAIDAVRKFVETVDRALPARADVPARRQEIVDSALEMADRLVKTQYDFLRKVVQSAGKTLGDSAKRR